MELQAISARNQVRGVVEAVKLGDVMGEVTLRLGDTDLRVVATVTRESAERLGLREGVEATALVKATDVLIMR